MQSIADNIAELTLDTALREQNLTGIKDHCGKTFEGVTKFIQAVFGKLNGQVSILIEKLQIDETGPNTFDSYASEGLPTDAWWSQGTHDDWKSAGGFTFDSWWRDSTRATRSPMAPACAD